MHSRLYHCGLILLVAAALIVGVSQLLKRVSGQEPTSRAPFSLELPDIDRTRITSFEVHIPKSEIHVLKLHIANPFADQIDYNNIYTVVNAESANTIQTITSAASGKVVTLDLESKQRFQLRPGKNVVEISAKDANKKQYYASFVLIADSSGPLKRSGATSPALSNDFTGRKFALVIGVSKYRFHEGGLNDLEYADSDARSISQFLKTRGGFEDSDIVCLENEKATAEGVRAAMQLFLPRANRNDMVFLFIASHGAQDRFDPKNLYLVLHDTKVNDMARTALKMTEIHELFTNKLRAKRIVMFVDACHSGAVMLQPTGGARQLERQENNTFSLYAEKLFQDDSRAILTSSDVNEISEEGANWGGGHGVFTWALLEGLRGAADVNRDRVLTAGEVFDYVSSRVRNETSSRQNPRALSGTNRDFPLAVVAK